MSGKADKDSLVSNLIDGFFEAAKNANTQMDKDNASDEAEDEEGEDDGIFEVDYIQDTKMKKGIRYFYVRWKGYDETEDSWEPEENLSGAKDIVKKFMETYKPKTKARQTKTPAKPASTSRKRPSRSREPSKEEEIEDEPESDGDEDFGSKRKKKKTEEVASTSKKQPPKAESYTSVPALNNCIKRRMNSNLRWLEDDDSDDNTDELDQKIPILAPIIAPVKKEEEPTVEINTDDSKSKEKKKKKKSKKHSKDRERSNSPESSRKAINNTISEKASVTFLGIYRPDFGPSKGDFRFIVKNNLTHTESNMTLAEAFLADGWQLCRYLASKIQFQANGEHKIEIAQSNGEPEK